MFIKLNSLFSIALFSFNTYSSWNAGVYLKSSVNKVNNTNINIKFNVSLLTPIGHNGSKSKSLISIYLTPSSKRLLSISPCSFVLNLIGL